MWGRRFGLAFCVLMAPAQTGWADAGEEWKLYEEQREKDIAALRKCIGTEDFLRSGAACAAVTVHQCHERLGASDKPVSRVDQDRCWEEEQKIWDLLYAETVELVLKGTILLDRDSFYIGSKNTGNMELFLKAESAWLSNLGNQCALAMAHWTGGTAGRTTYYVCHINRLAQHVSELNNLGLTEHVVE